MAAKVLTALENLCEQIREMEAAEQENPEDGEAQEELLTARRGVAAELRESARRLGGEEEEHVETGGTWTDYEAEKCRTQLVIFGLANEYDDYGLAAILGGGSKIRMINITATKAREVYVAYYNKEDATEGLATASADISLSGGPITHTHRAIYNHEIHGYERDKRAEKPRYKPFPTKKSPATGLWTEWESDEEGSMEKEEEGVWKDYQEEGGWKDYSKIDMRTTEKWKTSNTKTNVSTGASSSTTYADADLEDTRSKKRSRCSPWFAGSVERPEE
jgi:hypothetical protein